tara:strand:+ start:5144 stop:5497 length:354 start_codon:yes stop_codon:yes gene_type:complete
MNLLLIVIALFSILLINKIISLKKNKNNNLFKFKKKHLSKESNIEKIFSRDDEKKSSNPNININIGLYDNEENINRKSNIHRARLSKFKKSKLNGEIIFMDKDQKIYKYINGKKKYI